MLCLLNEEFLMRKNNLQREKLKLEVEKLFFLLQVHFPPLEYAKFTARKTRHEVDKNVNGIFNEIGLKEKVLLRPKSCINGKISKDDLLSILNSDRFVLILD